MLALWIRRVDKVEQDERDDNDREPDFQVGLDERREPRPDRRLCGGRCRSKQRLFRCRVLVVDRFERDVSRRVGRRTFRDRANACRQLASRFRSLVADVEEDEADDDKVDLSHDRSARDEHEDALRVARDEHVELDQERLERALSDPDKESTRSRPQVRRRVAQDDNQHHRHDRDHRVIRVVDKLVLACPLEGEIGDVKQRGAQNDIALPHRPFRSFGQLVLLDLHVGKRDKGAGPNDPQIERNSEPPFASVPCRTKYGVREPERGLERTFDPDIRAKERRSDDHLGRHKFAILVVLVADVKRDPDDDEPCSRLRLAWLIK